MLNIVENAICTFKAALKRDLDEARPNLIAMSHDERMVVLNGMIEVATEATQSHMAGNWFRNLQQRIPDCILMNDIFM